MRRITGFLAGFLLAGAFYLLLIDTGSTPELIAGGCGAVIAGAVYELAYAEGSGYGTYRLRWFRRTGRVLANAPVQVVIVCAEIAAQALAPKSCRGRLRATPFAGGSDRSARDLGRRALAEALGSLTPNTIVIGVDPEQDLLLVHQLRVDGGAEQLDPLGLGSAERHARREGAGP